MTTDEQAPPPESPLAGKEPWETPRVVASSVKEVTSYYGGADDHTISVS